LVCGVERAFAVFTEGFDVRPGRERVNPASSAGQFWLPGGIRAKITVMSSS
jgi:hypothetical protein